MAEAADCSSVYPSLITFQFADDLHRPYLGCARYSARRKSCPQCLEGRDIIAQSPHNVRDQVHDMRIAFDFHEIVYLDAAWLTDASNIVARKVDEHNVFGPLFGIAFQLFGKLQVALAIRATWTRPCDGANGDFSIFEAYEQFR